MRLGRRALTILALSVAGSLLGFDLAAPPTQQLSARALIAAVETYQQTLSPLLARSAVRCRFEPTCSHYAVGALRRYGTLKGGSRAAWRILRCAPWTPAGTVEQP